MKRENINRANQIVEALDELEEIIWAFAPDTAPNGQGQLLRLSITLWGHGNTAGTALQQKFNGVVGIKMKEPEHNAMIDRLVSNLEKEYLKECLLLKKTLEAELDQL